MKKRDIKRTRRLIPIFFGAVAIALIGTSVAVHNDWTIFQNIFGVNGHQVTATEEFVAPPDWKTCEETEKVATITNDNSKSIKVRQKYRDYWRNQEDTAMLTPTFVDEQDQTQNYAIINFQNQDKWQLESDGWYYLKEDLAPGLTSPSLFRSVEFNCDANFSGGDNVCHETATGQECEMTQNAYEGSTYHIKIAFQTCLVGDGESSAPGDIEECWPAEPWYDVSVNPNGGEYNGSSAIYENVVDRGTEIDLSDISWDEHHTFRDWTKNGSPHYTENSIVINEDTALIANWVYDGDEEHVVTVYPNGGSYNGTTEATTYNVRHNAIYNIGADTREGYDVVYWLKDDNTKHTDYLIVDRDMSITAVWAMARNERTQKLYDSITSAEAEAQNGDTITVLHDLEENFTNTKQIILNLDGHTVTGSITNNANANLTILDGEVNNPNGAAVTNLGTLTIGIDDYQDEVHHDNPLIDNTYVRLIGTTYGVDQRGTFNYYDGFLEGHIALKGDHHGTPRYHDSFDDRDVYYHPVVTPIVATGDQHAELGSADNAVSKTSYNGHDVYYYNLNDNIQSSAETGYTIYAITDFPATYTLNMPAAIGQTPTQAVTFDIDGYDVIFAEQFTNGGDFTIVDSKASTAPGSLEVMQTITNNGTLTIEDITATINNENVLISAAGNIVLHNSHLVKNANRGHVIIVTANSASLTMDNTSSISSNAGGSYSDGATIRNESSNLTINGGTIEQTNSDSYCSTDKAAIKNASSSNSVTINGGNIIAKQVGISGGNVAMTGGSITVTSESSSSCTTYGIYGTSNATISGAGVISVTNNYTGNIGSYAYGIRSTGGSLTMNGSSSIQVTTTRTTMSGSYDDTFGADVNNATLSGSSSITATGMVSTGVKARTTMEDDASITVNSTLNSRTTYGILGNTNMSDGSSVTVNSKGLGIGISGNSTLNDSASISVISQSGSARGIYTQGASIMNGGSIYVETGNSFAQGVLAPNTSNSTANSFTMNGGEIRVNVTGNAASYGAYGAIRTASYPRGGVITINHGTINATSASGTGYGIYGYLSNIYGGTIAGSNYGIYTQTSSESADYHGLTTLGDDDNHLIIDSPSVTGGDYGVYNGSVHFFDGIIRGGVHSYPDGVINTIADATKIHTETNLGVEESWLVEDGPYLYVNDPVKGYQEFTSLADAYEYVADGGTITVKRDFETSSSLPTNPSGKEITIDLNGKSLTYSTTLVNNGTIHVTDGVGGGSLNNISDNIPVFTNTGTITIESGTVHGANNSVITNSTTSASVQVNGGKITGEYVGVRGGNTVLNGGNIEVSSGARNVFGTYESNTTVQSTSQIKANATSSYAAYGIYAGTNNTVQGNGQIIVTTQSGSAYGINCNSSSCANVAVGNSGSISVTSNSGSATGINGVTSSSRYITVNGDGAITATSTSGVARGINNGSITVSDRATITTEGTHAIGVDGGSSLTMNNGTITAHATNGDAYGLMTSQTNSLNMASGTILATTDNELSYDGIGVYGYNMTIKSGSIRGSTNGVYIRSNGSTNYTATIGEDNDTVNIYTPQITGDTSSGIRGNNSGGVGNVYFYDGRFIGGYINIDFRGIADGTHIHTETISNRPNTWLKDEDFYLMVDGVRYNSLSKAYENVGSNGTIYVTDDMTTEAVVPASPSEKTNITLDLQGHTVTYKNTLTTNNVFTITNSDTQNPGKLSNYEKTTIQNNGTLTIDNVTIANTANGYNAINNNGTNNTITATDSTIVSTFYGIKNSGGTLSLTNTDINVTSSTTGAGIWNDGTIGNNTITLAGDSDITVNGSDYSYGIQGSFPVSMSGTSSITVSSTQSSSTLTKGLGAYSGNGPAVTMSDYASINVSSAGASVAGIYAQNKDVTLSDHVSITASSSASNSSANGIFVVTSWESTGQPISSFIDISDSVTISATGTNGANAYGAYLQYGSDCATIDGATITATSDTGKSYGIYRYNNGPTISNSTITATSNSGQSYGIFCNNTSNCKNMKVISGEVSGGTFGIYSTSDSVTLGADDGTVSTTSPKIISDLEAISSNNVIFYDGRLMGESHAYAGGHSNMVTTVPAGYTLYIGSETVSGTTYNVSYLTAEDWVAEVVGGSQYKKLSDAIANVGNNGTINLLADNHIFENLAIGSSKSFTIDTKGFEIISGRPIVNNGNLTITNGASANPVHQYFNSDYFITNNTGATLTLNNTKIKAQFGIENKGTLTMTNSSINAGETWSSVADSATALKNTGTAIIDGSTIRSPRTAINSSDDITIRNSSNIYGAFYALYSSSGTNTIANSTFSTIRSTSSNYYALYQTGSGVNTTSSNSTFSDGTSYVLASSTLTDTGSTFNGKPYNNSYYPFSNAGTLNLTGSTLDRLGGNRILNNTGNATIQNSTVGQSSTNTDYQLYNNSGATMSISGSSLANASYNIYNNGGTATITNNTATNSSTFLYNTGGGNSTTSGNTVSGGFNIYSGSLTSNNDTISINAVSSNNRDLIYFSGGTMDITGINATMSDANSSSSYTSYGLRSTASSTSSVAHIHSGTISVSTPGTAYGIYQSSNAKIILGDSEDGQPDYGTEYANVSTTNPSISGIGGVSGIGVQNTGGGTIEFYDGIMIGNTSAMPLSVNVTEYLYFANDQTDPNTGNYTRTLKFQRPLGMH